MIWMIIGVRYYNGKGWEERLGTCIAPSRDKGLRREFLAVWEHGIYLYWIDKAKQNIIFFYFFNSAFFTMKA